MCIFVDHIPGNQFARYTVRNLGISDASELFVFISAYSAGLGHMGRMRRDGLASASLRIWRRAGQIYVAHVLLLVGFCALVAWMSVRFDNLMYVQAMNIQSFVSDPYVSLLEALRLKFQPIFLDILPLYIVLLAVFPLVLWLIRRSPWLTLAASLGIYALAREWPIALSDYPRGEPWKFNPLAWQLLFTVGAALGAAAHGEGLRVRRRYSLLIPAAIYAIGAYLLAPMAWAYDASGNALPSALNALLFPVMDRTNLSLWRLAHVLALAYITTYFLRADHAVLRWRVMRPLTLCGQHSLPIYCLGVLLSIAGWAMLTEVGDSLSMQVLINVGGIALMTGVAFLLSLTSGSTRKGAFPGDAAVAGDRGNPAASGYNRQPMRAGVIARFVATAVFLAMLAGHPVSIAAQSRPDFSGIWIASAADISTLLLPGEEISFTPYGAERYKKLDMANSPSYKCLPYGPTRGLQSTNPFQIIQSDPLFAIITEHIDYRLIYTDGRGHPEDILDYPEWMGHSIGRWEGDSLVVDTIAAREETWLDTAGFEHSEKLRLIERLQKTGPDNFRITVTVEDPVFYTKPFTYSRVARRMAGDVRLMPARCADNENSLADALPGIQGPEHKNPPKLPR